jgi:DNA mismatch repair protein MutS
MSGISQLTPMMNQYRQIKSGLPKDALLLFRLGDFYEMFFEDAKLGSQILNLALTKRNSVPMCGIPYHAASTYVAKLLKSGYKVAICDQMEDARPGKLVKREITQILSPGTHLDERILTAEQNNFLAAISQQKQTYGIALVDISTGEFKTTELESSQELETELDRVRPAEVIVPSEQSQLKALVKNICKIVTEYDDWVFTPETAIPALTEHFKVASLEGFGLNNKLGAITAAGALIHYLVNHLRRDVRLLTRLNFYQRADCVILDSATIRNLEILEPIQKEAHNSASLFGAMNRTVTPMGARKLRDWISQPLSSIDQIQKRQSVVQAWLENPHLLDSFRKALEEIKDLERTLTRLSSTSGNARDLIALKSALEQIPIIIDLLSKLDINSLLKTKNAQSTTTSSFTNENNHTLLQELITKLQPQPELQSLISRAIVDDPPNSVRDGGFIREGFNPELDELRNAARDGKNWIAELQKKEIERTGIPSLKIRFNSVFGYYIEVTKSNLDKVPPDYIRKQTIVSGERFITPQLKEMETKILGAEERSTILEYNLFLSIKEKVLEKTIPLQQTAKAIAELDVLACFAENARLFGYCRPEIRDEGIIQITEGRHPVLDQLMTQQRFIPNDTHLNCTETQIMLITGPNMAGKSTYIRQVALLVILALTGSFIPARSARIDLVDKVFTRIGASDNLTAGQSTFMVEMLETANILNNATRKSLVILDEIGRGTSTFDGLSLAWAIVEHLHNQIGAKTLFATHYHELTELAERLPRLKNFNIAVKEWNEQIVFLHKILPGSTDKSYGIQVARLAGIPMPVIQRAKIILENLEATELNPDGTAKSVSRRASNKECLKKIPHPQQLDLFKDYQPNLKSEQN